MVEGNAAVCQLYLFSWEELVFSRPRAGEFRTGDWHGFGARPATSFPGTRRRLWAGPYSWRRSVVNFNIFFKILLSYAKFDLTLLMVALTSAKTNGRVSGAMAVSSGRVQCIRGDYLYSAWLLSKAYSKQLYLFSRVRSSISSGVLGQSSRSKRESARSASRRPPVWQAGQ